MISIALLAALLRQNDALAAIKDSQHRVNAMSLIHQKLFEAENMSTLNLTTYVNDLVNYLKNSFDTKQKIKFSTMEDPVELDVGQAVPLGLILKEAITLNIILTKASLQISNV